MSLAAIFPDVRRPVIGMIHLPPLAGSPRYLGKLQSVIQRAASDAQSLVEGGVHGLMVENFYDTPFFKDNVGPETVAQMTRVAMEVRQAVGDDMPMGINVLRNDALAALAVAHAVGAQYIRVNILSGAMLTDQGIIEGRAAELMRFRKMLAVEHIAVWADVRVKHAAVLAVRSLRDEVEDLCRRAMADAVIVSGSGTGRRTADRDAGAAQEAAGSTPVLIGSGVSAEQLDALCPVADGFIIGSGFKREGDVQQPVDPERVRSFMRELSIYP